MDENTTVVESVESQEVAEPDVESVEMEEAAELPARTEQDAAFAQLRREKQEAENRIRELEKSQSRMNDALGLWFDGDTPEKKIAQAIAYNENRAVSDVEAEFNKQRMDEAMQMENAYLKEQLQSIMADRAIEEDLKMIQAIDPEIKSLTDLGDTYTQLIAKGVDAKTAYYASKARMDAEKITLPKTAGKVAGSAPSNDTFTKEEVEANKGDKNWIKANLDKILASQSKW